MPVDCVGHVNVPVTEPGSDIGYRDAARETGRDERVPQAVRREPVRDAGLAGVGLELAAVAAVGGELPVRLEEVSAGQVLDDVPAGGIPAGRTLAAGAQGARVNFPAGVRRSQPRSSSRLSLARTFSTWRPARSIPARSAAFAQVTASPVSAAAAATASSSDR